MQDSDSDDDVEFVEADLECEFLYALKKIKKLKRNLSVQENKFLKEKENFKRETKDLNQQVIELKLQVEEQKRIFFVTKEELSSKD